MGAYIDPYSAAIGAAGNMYAASMPAATQLAMNAMYPGYSIAQGNQAASQGLYAAIPGSLNSLFGFLSTYPQATANVVGGANQAGASQANALNNALSSAYAQQLGAELGGYTQGPYIAGQNLQGNIAALQALSPIQQLQGTVPVGEAQALGAPVANVLGQEVQAAQLPLLTGAQNYTQGIVPQSLAQMGLAQNEQNILGQENLGALNQQGNLFNTATNAQAQQLMNQLTQGSGVENVNTQTQGNLLGGINQSLANTALGTGGYNLQGQTANLGAASGLEGQAQGILGNEAALIPQLNANLAGQNVAASVAGTQATVPAYLQGALAGLNATAGGQYQTQQLGSQLANSLVGGDIQGALQPGQVLSQTYPAQSQAQSGLAQALANTYEQPTLASISQLGPEGQAAIGAQVQGGENAQNLNAQDYMSALNSVAKTQGLMDIFGNLFGGNGGLIRQIGTGPGNSGLNSTNMPAATPLPPLPTSVTGYTHTGEPFQNISVNEALPSGTAGGAPVASQVAAVQPSFADQLSQDLGAALAHAPQFSNPYSAQNTASVMSPLVAEGNKPTVAPSMSDISQAPLIGNQFNVNPADSQSFLSQIGSFGNPYQGPLDNISGAAPLSNPLPNPQPSFGVPLVGHIANTYHPDTAMQLGAPLSTGLVSAPNQSWTDQFTQGVASVPLPGIATPNMPSQGAMPDVTGILSNLAQPTNTQSGALTNYLNSIYSSANGASPWTGTATPNLKLSNMPNFEQPSVISSFGVQLPSVPALSSLLG